MELIAPHAFTELGGKERPTDDRDLKLGAATAITYNFPATLTNASAWSAPVEYQGQQPACGSHSGAKASDLIKGGLIHSTPRFTWNDIKSFDGLPIDVGTDMRSIFKSLTISGTLDFPVLGNDVTLDTNVYARAGVSQAMIALASNRKGGGYGFANDVTFKGIKQFIADHGPCILLIQVGPEFWTAPNGQSSWVEKDILPLRYPPSIVSGHFIVAHSYDENYIYFLNSFSDVWGRKGHGYFGENYMKRVLEVGTLFPLSYSKDLYQGITDPDVKRLQVQLNTNPATQVAKVGAGSPGNETQYFGALTFAAVKKYQALHGISPTGYCGPLTRASLTKL